MIKFEQFNFCYDKYSPFKKEIFCNVNFELYGKKVLFRAPSGSGKSTLFKVILGEYKGYKNPYETRILLQNIDVQLLTSSVYDEINLGYKIKYKKDVPREVVKDELNKFDLSKKLEDDPNDFSGGEKKIILLIALFLAQPELLILDEPFVGLDEKHIALLEKKIVETDINLIVASHKVYNNIFDQVVTIKDKQLVGVYE